MKFTTTAMAASMAALAIAAPTLNVQKRDCSQYGSVTEGSYTLYNDLWGESAATSGSQCVTESGFSNNILKWSTTWSWQGGANSVKSYANAVVAFTHKPISQIESMQSTFDWSYTGSNVVADVSYDMFTSSTASGSNQFEIMVWLAALGGAGPISSSYGSDGQAVAVASPTIDGHSFKLYKGPNGSTTVYSFVATSTINNFSGDVKAFFTYLVANEGFSSSQYLTSVGAGTEAFTGSNADFTVSAYSMVVS